ncbi:MAG: rod shape-determining protein MreD [Bacteroidetes bacterium]|nr:rod shape-determining protein MreD [Bacteroidota bacterium]
MIVKIIQNIFRFLFLVIIQVLVLNHIQWSGFVNPYIYVMFILMLPYETPKWLLLLTAFVTGLTMDMFGNSGAIHAAATVLMAFSRPRVLQLIAPRDGYETETKLTPFVMGIKWYITYVSLSVFIHHFAYFFIEVFRFEEFFFTLAKVILNSVITILLIILGQYIFSKRSKKAERVLG